MFARRTKAETVLYESRATCEAMAKAYLKAVDQYLGNLRDVLSSAAPEDSEYLTLRTLRHLRDADLVAYGGNSVKGITRSNSVEPGLRRAVKAAVRLGSARSGWFMRSIINGRLWSIPDSFLATMIESRLGRSIASASAPLDALKARYGKNVAPIRVALSVSNMLDSAAEKLGRQPKELIPHVNFNALPPDEAENIVHQALRAELEKVLSVASTDPSKPHTDDENYEVFLRIAPGRVWVMLSVGACSKEAKRMQHCGNVGQVKEGDRVLSLRIYNRDDRKWRVHATAILNSKNKTGGAVITEIVGRANSNPFEKYGLECLALLNDSRVSGIMAAQRWGDLDSISGRPKKKIISDTIFDKCRSCGEFLTEPPEYCAAAGCDRVFCSACLDTCDVEGCGRKYCPDHAGPHLISHTPTCAGCGVREERAHPLTKCASCADRLCQECAWDCPKCEAIKQLCATCAAHHRRANHVMACGLEGCFTTFYDPEVEPGHLKTKCQDCGGYFCREHAKHSFHKSHPRETPNQDG